MNDDRKKILLVDDDKFNVITLAHYLKPEYEIIVALDGAAAIEMAKEQKPDLILLDIIMPEMNGFNVLAKLKKSKTTMDIPIIFITRLDTEQFMIKGLSLGAVGYISKPFDKSEVKAKIEEHLRKPK